MLYHGRIHFTGTPDETLQSTDPIVHRFVNGISDPKEPSF
jgi:ABC-type transporter Mla maintaining outer membrane lipid asymmetry ATPase subunit MlaF